MGTFNYRALTEDGRIVSNKVEEGNRLTLVKKLKEKKEMFLIFKMY